MKPPNWNDLRSRSRVVPSRYSVFALKYTLRFVLQVASVIVVLLGEGTQALGQMPSADELSFRAVRVAGVDFKVPNEFIDSKNTIVVDSLIAIRLYINLNGKIDRGIHRDLDSRNSLLVSLIENQSFENLTDRGLLERLLSFVKLKEVERGFEIYSGSGSDLFISVPSRTKFFTCSLLPLFQRTAVSRYGGCTLAAVYKSGIELQISFPYTRACCVTAMVPEIYAVLRSFEN